MKTIRYSIGVSIVALLVSLQVFAVALDTRSVLSQRRIEGQVSFSAGEILEVAMNSRAWIFSRTP